MRSVRYEGDGAGLVFDKGFGRAETYFEETVWRFVRRVGERGDVK